MWCLYLGLKDLRFRKISILPQLEMKIEFRLIKLEKIFKYDDRRIKFCIPEKKPMLACV